MNAHDFDRIDKERQDRLRAKHADDCQYIVETIDTYPAHYFAMRGTCTCGADDGEESAE